MRSTDSGSTSSSSSPLSPIPGRAPQPVNRAANPVARSVGAPRKSYSAPQLTHYGHIEKITMASGSDKVHTDFGMGKVGFGSGGGEWI